ncbi:hypothetical protein [Methylovirgula sp. 4M-Z18]|uniref:hypothetical protein n=1 Tax=Methylovirgula sp. 4M-Z18 TaxID=2293567 RepID=UPI0011C07ED3|nr:hypothetical protein [Methylovirgula sp. 4M-Z18]
MRLSLIGVILVLALAPQTARACGYGPDDDAFGRWGLDQRTYNGYDGLPFLSPGNDTRINLQMLMMDAGSQAGKLVDTADQDYLNSYMMFPNFNIKGIRYSSGLYSIYTLMGDDAPVNHRTEPNSVFSADEGTRCVSFDKGQQAFASAAQAESSLSDSERTQLIAARAGLNPACRAAGGPGDGTASSPLPTMTLTSPAARDFGDYLAGAQAFYDGNFDAALEHFNRLAKAQNTWLRESAGYMVGRTLLNKAQRGAFDALDGTPEPKLTDRTSADTCETAFKTYLSAYPNGQYVASARGLLRRLYWLQNDTARLGNEYSWQMSHIGDSSANLKASDLLREIDAKYLPDAKLDARDPLLLATKDLTLLRDRGSDGPTFSAADLEAQAPDFAGHEALFTFLKAARVYYIDHDAAAALQLLGSASSEPSSPPYLGFSREVLRGQALMAQGQFAQAADHWSALLPRVTQRWQKETVELGLAMSWERAGTANKVFLPPTRVDTLGIRAVLLRHTAGPILLRMAVADPQSTPPERALARFVLLFKEITRGHYTGFLQDVAAPNLTADDDQAPEAMKLATFLQSGTNESYPCPDLKTIAGELARNPRSAHGLLCLGDFVRTSALDDFEAKPPAANELGGAKPIFPGEPFARGEIYKNLIADAATPEKERAYALYRAIYCYARVGNNSCGGKAVDKAQRKAWFHELKTKYAATSWAQDLQYYW